MATATSAGSPRCSNNLIPRTSSASTPCLRFPSGTASPSVTRVPRANLDAPTLQPLTLLARLTLLSFLAKSCISTTLDAIASRRSKVTLNLSSSLTLRLGFGSLSPSSPPPPQTYLTFFVASRRTLRPHFVIFTWTTRSTRWRSKLGVAQPTLRSPS